MKKKGLRPLIFALIFAMLLTSMNAAPVLAAKKPCNHIYAEFIYGEDGKLSLIHISVKEGSAAGD